VPKVNNNDIHIHIDNKIISGKKYDNPLFGSKNKERNNYNNKKSTINIIKIISILFLYIILPLLAMLAFEVYITNADELFKLLNTNNNTYTHVLINKIYSYPWALVPVLYFIIVQLLLHSIFILYTYLSFTSLKGFLNIFKNNDKINYCKSHYNQNKNFLRDKTLKYFGFILFLILNYIFILSINSTYYPNSKFYLNILDNQYIFIASTIILYFNFIIIILNFVSNNIQSKKLIFSLLLCTFCAVLYNQDLGYIYYKLGIQKSIYNIEKVAQKKKGNLNIAQIKNSSKPNIILITIDSFRADYLNKIFSVDNDFLDIPSLTKNSALFTNAYTPLARSFPALYSILSGNYPKKAGLRFNLTNQDNINFSTLLPNIFKKQGYDTFYSTDANQFHVINKKWGYNTIAVPKQGIYEQILPSLNDLPLSNLIINKYISNYLFPYTYANASAKKVHNPKSYVNKVNKYLSNVDFNKPVFLHFNFEAAHWPYENKDTNKKLYFQDKYLASLNIVNFQINKIFKLLNNYNQKILDNTIVILASDHGEALGLSDDRIISKQNYTGKKNNLELISKYPINFTFKEVIEKQQNNKQFNILDNILSINTSGGHGVDVLSTSQYKVVLAMQHFKNNKKQFKPKQIDDLVILNDVYPTILSLAGLKKFQNKPSSLSYHQNNQDVTNLLLANTNNTSNHDKQKSDSYNRYIFLETGLQVPYFKASELEDKKTLKKFISAWSKYYQIDNDLLLEIKPEYVSTLLPTKQYAVLDNNNFLAYIPKGMQQNWEMLNQLSTDNKNNSADLNLTENLDDKCLLYRKLKDINNSTIAILCNNYTATEGYYIHYTYDNSRWNIYPNDYELKAAAKHNKNILSLYNKLKTYYNNEIIELS